MVLAIAATSCASAMVLYFQYDALTALREQRRVILKQVSQQAATEVAQQLRAALNGPVIDTINALDPPKLRETGLDWLGNHFRTGLERYPQVDRFVVGMATTKSGAAAGSSPLGQGGPGGRRF